jgi:hypothetical protein
LTVDNFGDWEKSSAYMRKALEFGANPPGAYVDPENDCGSCGWDGDRGAPQAWTVGGVNY